MRDLDIAIAGCGIAGLACAIILSRQGHRATIYERFEEPKPLGSGLMIQPTGLSVLHALGMAEKVVAAGSRVDGLLGLNTENEPALEADYHCLGVPDAFGLGIHRASLFDALHDAAKDAGVEFVTGFDVAGAQYSGGRVILADSTSRPSRAHDLVVDALGTSSPLVPQRADAVLPFGALWASVDWPSGSDFNPRLLEQRYAQSRRMVGVLPIGPGDNGPQRAAFFWSLKGDDYESWRAGGMDAWWHEVCDLWPACEALRSSISHPDQLVFARYAHRTSPQSGKSGDGKIVHIGDAWHAASPQLGQGANMALLDAFALAKSVAQAGDLPSAKAQFLHLRRGHVRLYQWLTWAFTPPFQSDAAWPAALRDLLMAPASRIPPAPGIKAHLVAGLAGNPLAPLGLVMPNYSALASAASNTASRASALSQS